jgi:glycosyltransferase involved in cell wall biosynthesis
MKHELLLKWFIGAGIRAADIVVAVSQYTARSLEMVFGYNDATVILNGVDTAFFKPGSDAHSIESERGDLKLLFVGHLIRRKGADLLPEIMRQLGSGFELRFTSGWRQNLKIDVLPNMTPIGLVDQARLREEYRNADIVIFPTRFDGFGLPVVEAMACGTPAIASDCCAVPELIHDGVDGVICPLEDVGAFVTAIRNLAADRDQLAAMAVAARQTAETRFDLRRMVRDYVQVFLRLIEKAV